MTRIAAVLAILLLILIPVIANLGGDDGEPIRLRDEPDLGEGYAYNPDTLRRFRMLVESEAWGLPTPPRNHQGMLLAIHCRTGLRFVLLPEGEFLMGSREGPGAEWPIRSIRIPAFLMATTECTRSAWASLSGTGLATRPASMRPIFNLTVGEIEEWCSSLGLRLPSEAEWEYACRATSTSRWCFGDDVSLLDDYCWYGDSTGSSEPVEVGLKEPNAWGLYDMHGNMWELCADDYSTNIREHPSDGSPFTKADRVTRVLRGGNWFTDSDGTQSSARAHDTAQGRSAFRGFRPAASLPTH